MSKKSAGLLIYKYDDEQQMQVLLVHPGGPFYAKKDAGVWGIPKGEYEDGEDPLAVAKREFNEETGNTISADTFVPLTPIKIRSGKVISAWAVQTDFEQAFITSNYFEMEWPPKSGKKKSFAEVDKAEWFTLNEAKSKINPGQVGFINELVGLVGIDK